MKQGWEYKKLGEIGSVITGNTPSTSNALNYSSDDICFVKPSDIGKEGITNIDETEFHVSTYAYNNSCRKIPHNSVLVSCIGIIGKIGILKKDATCNQQINAIVPNDSVMPRFLAYSILSQRNYIQAIANAPVVPIINKGQFSSLSVPVPPLPEQQTIVAELDKISELIDKGKEQLKELDNLAQAIFYDMFGDPITNEKGWEVKPMNEVAPTVEYKGVHPLVDNKMWLLNLDKVEQQTGKILDYDYYSEDEIGSSVISFNDTNVLYSKLRPYLNKVVVPNDIGFATSELLPLQPKKNLLERQYLAFMLRNNSFVSYINLKVAGAKMPRVSMDTFRNFLVPIPPLPLQQSFAEKVEAIEKQKALVTQSIQECQTLFDSRMDYYFGD